MNARLNPRRIEPLEKILQSTRADRVQLLFSDRPENDFSTLSGTITAWSDALDKAIFPHSIFLGMIPRSFYRDVVQPRSVDLGFSLACLHHLEHVPKSVDDQLPAPDEKLLFQAQAHTDMCLFLKLRADEVATGGFLVLSFVSQASSGRENYAGLVDACRNGMIQMVQDGKLPVSVAMNFRIPTYNRTLGDVRKAIDELSGIWAAHEIFEDEVLHPAILEMENQKREGQNDQASRWYADTVVDWLMAVCSGYFLKAISFGPQDAYTEAEADELLKEWVHRTKELFIRDHKDEEVFCSFIYVRLERL